MLNFPETQLLLDALEMVKSLGSWVVVVCPTDLETQKALKTLAAAIDSRDKFAGRTVATYPQGHLTILAGVDEFTAPNKQPFSVLFLGIWQNNSQDMLKWRKRAS